MYKISYNNVIYLILLILFLSFLFVYNPLILGLVLILLTFFMSIFSMFISISVWNGYFLFLMFLGGLLILFLYNISLISTEMFSLEMTFTMFLWVIACLSSMKEIHNFNIIDGFISKSLFPTSLFLMSLNIDVFLFLIFYLFFCLICIVNIIKLNMDKGSLRS